MATINMHMKFEIEIPKHTWLMLRKPFRLQTDGRTDGQTDEQGESSIPPLQLRWAGYNKYDLVKTQRGKWRNLCAFIEAPSVGSVSGEVDQTEDKMVKLDFRFLSKGFIVPTYRDDCHDDVDSVSK